MLSPSTLLLGLSFQTAATGSFLNLHPYSPLQQKQLIKVTLKNRTEHGKALQTTVRAHSRGEYPSKKTHEELGLWLAGRVLAQQAQGAIVDPTLKTKIQQTNKTTENKTAAKDNHLRAPHSPGREGSATPGC